MPKPSQFAREAAWPLRPSCYKDDPVTKAHWMDGVYDKIAQIQAFSQFERETLERAAKVAENFQRWSGSAPLANEFDKAGIASAIRAMKGEGG